MQPPIFLFKLLSSSESVAALQNLSKTRRGSAVGAVPRLAEVLQRGEFELNSCTATVEEKLVAAKSVHAGRGLNSFLQLVAQKTPNGIGGAPFNQIGGSENFQVP